MRLRNISYLERTLLLKHLSVLLASGMPLPESLALLEEQARSRRLRGTLTRIREKVEAGHSFAEALGEVRIFPLYITRLLRAAEYSGNMEDELTHLAKQLAKEMAIRRAIRSALMYPAVVVTVAVALGTWLAVFILPKLTSVFLSLRIHLPLPTRILLAVTGFIGTYWIWILAGGVATVFFMIALMRTDIIRPLWYRLLFRLPGPGMFLQDIALARLTRVLHSLLRGGIPLSESLAICAASLTNPLYTAALLRVRNASLRGSSIGKSFAREPHLFPPLVSRMIVIGEQSGTLEQLLEYLARYYEDEVENASRNFSALIEPILIVGLGVIVLWIALSIILPIAQLYGSLAG